MTDNNLRLVIYSSGTTIDAPTTGLVKDHEALSFQTMYPGGLYSTASFFVKCDPTRPHPAVGGKRIEIFNGLKTVWEGVIEVFAALIQGGESGFKFECTGYWGVLAGRTKWDKVWCDTRIDDNTWFVAGTPFNSGDKTLIKIGSDDRNDRIRITPKNEAWPSGGYYKLEYKMPTGQTVKRLTGNYDMQEGAENWNLKLFNITAGADDWSVTTSGTGAIDETLGTASQRVFFYFEAGAAQTPASSGTYYGQLTNLKVYGELGSINPTEILKDIIGQFSVLNSDTSYIGSNTTVVEPCLMEWESIADFSSKLASYGDASYNPWVVGIQASSTAGTPDGKPVLFYEQQPVLTSYDYVVRLEEIEGQFTVEQAFDEVYNDIVIEYKDEKGRANRKTSADDATLKDTTSIDTYGKRNRLISIDNSGSAITANFAKRYLASFKDPKWRMSSPITIKGRIRTSGRNYVPVCWVRAGQRVMVENYLQEMDGAGIIFLISETSFDEDSETVTITAGSPDPLETLVARSEMNK